MTDGLFIGLQHPESTPTSRRRTSRSRSTSTRTPTGAGSPPRPSGQRIVQRHDLTSRRHAVRHVRRRHRGQPGQASRRSSRCRSPSPSTAPQDADGQAHRESVTFGGSGRRRGPGGTCPTTTASVFGANGLELARRVGRLAVLLLRRADRSRPRQRCSWPTRPGTTTRPSHRPRHADLRTVGEPATSCSTDGAFGAPYVLGTVGGSQNTNLGAGVWPFDTATGGADDLVAGPAQEGLHAILEHQVQWNGGCLQRARSRRPSAAPRSNRPRSSSTTTGEHRRLRRDVRRRHRPARARRPRRSASASRR